MILLRSWTDRRAGGEKEIVEKGSCVELEFGLVGEQERVQEKGLQGGVLEGERGVWRKRPATSQEIPFSPAACGPVCSFPPL
jgi:hypothetical protein